MALSQLGQDLLITKWCHSLWSPLWDALFFACRKKESGSYQTKLSLHKFPAHKDPYENIYVVVRGHKDVILHAPTDQPWLGYANFRQAVYRAL